MHVKLGLDRAKRDLLLQVEERGCSNSFVIREISVIPDLDFFVRDSLLCQPLKFDFSATNTENVVDYFWEWGDGKSEHNGSLASHNYDKEGYYAVQLTATTDKKCINTVKKDSVLYVAPVPTVSFSINDNSCLGLGPQSLLYTGSADDMDHYHWDLSSFLPNELIQNPGDTKGPFIFDLIEKPKADIKLQVTSKYGCISENKSFVLQRIPKFSLSAVDTIGCIPLIVSLDAATGDKVDKVDYSWNFGDGKYGAGASVTHTYPVPDQSHDITLFAKSNITGCKDTIYKPNLVTVFPEPKAIFTLKQKLLGNDNPVAIFNNQSEGADHYLWQFDDGLISHTENPVHTYDVVGRRRVLLEAANQFGCTDTISEEVLISLSRIFAPNAFTPNAPNPVDREFFPFCNGVLEKGYHLRILSRWNDVIYESKDVLKGWNGELSNGTLAPAGIYIWVLYFTDFLGKYHFQNGTVSLIY
jgi:PKD repeat protein